jgi:transposase-like protein
MPQPTFGARGVLVDAVAMAVREAWAVEAGARRNYVATTLRRLVGDALADQALVAALKLLDLQPAAPTGDIEPPATALLSLCARCKQIKLREQRRPYRGKIHMEVLRDAEWMRRQFERLGRTDQDLAEDLQCHLKSVTQWRNRHGILPHKSNRKYMDPERLHRLIHVDRLAPGEIAEKLECDAATVQRWARQLGVVRTYKEHAHHTEAWWRERVHAGWTYYRMAEAAGIKKHSVFWHLRKWGLYTRKGSRASLPRYPQLYEAEWLARALDGTTEYARVAREVGCSASTVKFAAVKLGLVAPKNPPRPTPWVHDPAWYHERLARRMTAEQMAAEVGLQAKSVLNYMIALDVAPEYYRLVERWHAEELAKTRERIARRVSMVAT